MSDTFNLENLTVEEANKLLESGNTSAQDLLGSVVRADTSKYNPEIQKFEPNQELINKQTKLANFCVAKGAKLKDAFQNVHDIPASFIENNLQLLITSRYKPTEILQRITSNLYGLSDPLSLITKLIGDHKADASKLSYISSDLNINSIEFLLSRGLKGDVLLMPAFQNSDKEKQKELLDLAFKHGASSSSFKSVYAALENLNEDVFKMLITKHKVSLQDLLGLVVRASTSQYNQANQKSEPNQELINKQTALTNFLIGNGANLKDITNSSSDFVKNNLQLIINNKVKVTAKYLDLFLFDIEELEMLLKHNISPQNLFKRILSSTNDHAPLSEESIIKLKNLIELTRLNNVNFNKVFSEYLKANHSINSDIFKYLLESKLIEATLALEYAIRNVSIDLANLAFNYQPDINSKSQSSNLTLLDKALMTNDPNIINWLLDKGVKHDVNYEAYLSAISDMSFNNACKIIARLPEIYSQDKTYECLRAEGSSISLIKSFTDYYNLIVDYVAATHSETTSLSELEQRILTPDSIIEVGNTSTNITNIYGYTPLHLAIIAGKYDLAHKMIEAGHDIYAQNKNGTTPLELIIHRENANHSERQTLEQLKKLIITKVDNIDILSDNGESLADILMQSQETLDTVLSKTQDPLFHFYKPDNTSSNLDPEKVHIAISNGEGFWSTGAWAVARLLMKEHKDVEFHLVSYDMLKQGGDNFIKQFDAFINPGAADSYPRNLSEFTKKDCQFSMELEQLYQLVLQKTDELKIPYLGICAGAQHFALYHQGTLAPLDGYNMGKHEIEFVKGTTPYFLSLTPEQQWQALKVGIFPQVKFQGYTAHHFAALNGKIGQDI
jgi:ankyrin repeat protein